MGLRMSKRTSSATAIANANQPGKQAQAKHLLRLGLNQNNG
jgi:hypothetical protein